MNPGYLRDRVNILSEDLCSSDSWVGTFTDINRHLNNLPLSQRQHWCPWATARAAPQASTTPHSLDSSPALSTVAAFPSEFPQTLVGAWCTGEAGAGVCVAESGTRWFEGTRPGLQRLDTWPQSLPGHPGNVYLPGSLCTHACVITPVDCLASRRLELLGRWARLVRS